MALLDVNNLTIKFGGLVAVDDFNISLDKNELVGLIGPNGAGKTTVFNMLTGVYLPTSGDIAIDGKSVVGKKPYNIVEMGASRTFQNIRLFNEMSVLDNIKIAYSGSQSYSIFTGVLRLPKFWKEEAEANKKCMELLSVFDLEKYADAKAGSLPYGQQRKLEIARALATDPKVLLLDEPAAGMNPNETIELMETIRFVKKTFDIAILLIEHDMHFVMNICERIVVIDYGKTIAKGLPDEIKKNPDVIKAYLGS